MLQEFIQAKKEYLDLKNFLIAQVKRKIKLYKIPKTKLSIKLDKDPAYINKKLYPVRPLISDEEVINIVKAVNNIEDLLRNEVLGGINGKS